MSSSCSDFLHVDTHLVLPVKETRRFSHQLSKVANTRAQRVIPDEDIYVKDLAHDEEIGGILTP
jgi:hypothetical protein